MRTVAPVKRSSVEKKKLPEWTVLVRISFGLLWFRERLKIDMTVSGLPEDGEVLSDRQKRMARMALYAILGGAVVLMVSGAGFAFYLFKSALGIDYFRDFHLFK